MVRRVQGGWKVRRPVGSRECPTPTAGPGTSPPRTGARGRTGFQSHQEPGLTAWERQATAHCSVTREHYFSTSAVPWCVTGFTCNPPQPGSPPAQQGNTFLTTPAASVPEAPARSPQEPPRLPWSPRLRRPKTELTEGTHEIWSCRPSAQLLTWASADPGLKAKHKHLLPSTRA